MNSIGLIGLGIMGSVSAPKFLDAGHHLAVFDVSDSALAKAQTSVLALPKAYLTLRPRELRKRWIHSLLNSPTLMSKGSECRIESVVMSGPGAE